MDKVYRITREEETWQAKAENSEAMTNQKLE